jgi:hypothetical protein
MIQYSLKCREGHGFDSWFQSADAFDKLKASGHLACAICGSGHVEKAIMAPRVTSARKKAALPAAESAAKLPAPMESTPMGSARGAKLPEAKMPDPKMQEALAAVKREVEANSDYVGTKFVAEARAMHLGDAPERSIYGEAKVEEAKALIEDGVPVVPLPFTPTRKTN